MPNKIVAAVLTLAAGSLLFITGCYKVTTLTVNNEQAVTTTVNFSANIVPVFSKSCALSGCHSSGGVKPDLTAANAYNSIITGNYADLGTPENSDIYRWLTGKEAATMPLGAANNPSNINQLVLAWIKQGAKNN